MCRPQLPTGRKSNTRPDAKRPPVAPKSGMTAAARLAQSTNKEKDKKDEPISFLRQMAARRSKKEEEKEAEKARLEAKEQQRENSIDDKLPSPSASVTPPRILSPSAGRGLDESFDEELELLHAERSIVEAVQDIGTTSADEMFTTDADADEDW